MDSKYGELTGSYYWESISLSNILKSSPAWFFDPQIVQPDQNGSSNVPGAGNQQLDHLEAA